MRSPLILGAAGQVGSHLKACLNDALTWGRTDADFAHPAALEAAVLEAAPSAIVNTAAYTAVDQAEAEPDLTWRVNAEAVAALARAAARLRVPLIHLSTDYVFDGHSQRPYLTADGARPLNAYGRSKLAGDLAAMTLCPKHWVIRPSAVFSAREPNFVTTMLRLARELHEVSVVDDQYTRPTYAGDIAKLLAALLARIANDAAPPPGLYHIGGGPEVTWHGFARDIFDGAEAHGLLDRPPRLIEISTADYPTAARRPPRSTLAPDHGFQRALAVQPDWHEGLNKVLATLAGED